MSAKKSCIVEYLRVHGPSTAREIAHAIGRSTKVVSAANRGLAARGRIRCVDTQPTGHGPDMKVWDVCQDTPREAVQYTPEHAGGIVARAIASQPDLALVWGQRVVA
jgi:hypothetical protein